MIGIPVAENCPSSAENTSVGDLPVIQLVQQVSLFAPNHSVAEHEMVVRQAEKQHEAVKGFGIDKAA
ncbi:hypothetical protein PQX77_020084, partial [Marasmius sp. AFHP31]